MVLETGILGAYAGWQEEAQGSAVVYGSQDFCTATQKCDQEVASLLRTQQAMESACTRIQRHPVCLPAKPPGIQ